ncbi:hypothetical protein MKZ38_001836 [Zalerion maritima]|uniref:Transmembrane protein n=1 Tax=Zalerion maritima TaxID=339359 RepID=A0AAD5RRE1_9PEZI|nr:hypothetical protein MKZ38_001836 [Zalerion maritima]
MSAATKPYFMPLFVALAIALLFPFINANPLPSSHDNPTPTSVPTPLPTAGNGKHTCNAEDASFANICDPYRAGWAGIGIGTLIGWVVLGIVLPWAWRHFKKQRSLKQPKP